MNVSKVDLRTTKSISTTNLQTGKLVSPIRKPDTSIGQPVSTIGRLANMVFFLISDDLEVEEVVL